MSLSTIISVGLGLILIYYALGLVVNATTQIVKISLDLRARALTEMLVDVMGDKSQDFKQLGLIQTLKPLGKRLFTKERDVAEIPKSTFSLSILELLQPKDSQYLVTAVHIALNRILDQFSLDQGTQGRIKALLAYETDEELLAQLRELIRSLPDEKTVRDLRSGLTDAIDSLARAGERELEENRQLITAVHATLNRVLAQLSLDNDTRQKIESLLELDDPKALLAQVRDIHRFIPEAEKVTVLRTALLNALDLLLGSPETQLARIRAGIQQLPADSKGRKALESAIDFGVSDVNQARARIEAWYDDAMKNANELFTRRVRRWVIGISLIVTLVVGGDTIAIARALMVQPVDEATVEEFVNQFPPDVTAVEGEASLEDLQKQAEIISGIVQSLAGLKLPMPWWRDPPTTLQEWSATIMGLAFTWLAVSQGSSFWYDILKAIKPGSAPPPNPPKRDEQEG
jgi:hypothetical protein